MAVAYYAGFITMKKDFFFLFVLTTFCFIFLITFVFPEVFPLKNQTCANSVSCVKNLSGDFEFKAAGEYMGKKFTDFSPLLSFMPPLVLGESTGGEKHIYVDLARQLLEAYEGDKLIMSFPVSTGKWFTTPTGDFRIWVKLRFTRMTGGKKDLGTYYDLPNVPYTMFFYNNDIPKTRGFGLHGAYWHNNFGHVMSHGCVNISPQNAKALYEWALPETNGKNIVYATSENPGTLITIYGESPKE